MCIDYVMSWSCGHTKYAGRKPCSERRQNRPCDLQLRVRSALHICPDCALACNDVSIYPFTSEIRVETADDLTQGVEIAGRSSSPSAWVAQNSLGFPSPLPGYESFPTLLETDRSHSPSPVPSLTNSHSEHDAQSGGQSSPLHQVQPPRTPIPSRESQTYLSNRSADEGDNEDSDLEDPHSRSFVLDVPRRRLGSSSPSPSPYSQLGGRREPRQHNPGSSSRFFQSLQWTALRRSRSPPVDRQLLRNYRQRSPSSRTPRRYSCHADEEIGMDAQPSIEIDFDGDDERDSEEELVFRLDRLKLQ